MSTDSQTNESIRQAVVRRRHAAKLLGREPRSFLEVQEVLADEQARIFQQTTTEHDLAHEAEAAGAMSSYAFKPKRRKTNAS